MTAGNDIANEIATSLAKIFEGLWLTPYLCPAKVPTIGYGTTAYPDGRKVTLQDRSISKEQAEEYLAWEMAKCISGAIRVCPVLLQYPKAWGAVADFCFNLGIGRLQASTLRRRINQGNWQQAQQELSRWVYAAGKKLPGLVARRKAESLYFPSE